MDPCVNECSCGHCEHERSLAQIRKCQDPWADGRSYSGWHDYAEQQTKAGKRQHFCSYCRRYKFPDELCRFGRADKEMKERKDAEKKAKA